MCGWGTNDDANIFSRSFGHCPCSMKVVVGVLILHWSLVHSSPELSRRIRGSPNELTLSCRDEFGIAFPDAEFWLNSSTRLTDLLSTGSYDLRSNRGELDFTINPDLEGYFSCGSSGHFSNPLELTGKSLLLWMLNQCKMHAGASH